MAYDPNANAVRSAGEITGQSQVQLADAIARKYGIPRDAAMRTLNYIDKDTQFRPDGNWDDEVEWNDKRIQQAIGQLGQEDGVDYFQGGTLQKKGQADAAAEKAKTADEWMAEVKGQLEAFAKEMNLSYDDLLAQGDKGALAMQDRGYNQAAASSQDRGLSGGLSNYSSEKSRTDSLLGYQMQRQGMGLQALNSLGGLAQNAVGTAEGRRQFDAGLNLQMQDRQAQANAQAFQEKQGLGQTIGAIGGGVLGGVAGFVGSGFNPLGGAAGASIGSSLGSGVGGAIAGGGGYQPYRYKSPGGGGRSGYGLGGYGNY